MRITRSIVPNLFTLVNLYMGFTAIVHIADQQFFQAAMFILIAGLFDMLDGVVARLVKSASEFGAELDSLCDAVSFGVAPSYMLYKAYLFNYGDMGILLASLPALAGVFRLARFNINMNSFEDKKYFTGLAIPAGAIIIITYVIYFHETSLIPYEFKPLGIILITVITSLAMVSRIKFDNIPRPSLKGIKQKPVIFSMFAVGVIASIVTKGKFILPFMLFYVLASTIRHFYNWVKETREAADDIDESLPINDDD